MSIKTFFEKEKDKAETWIREDDKHLKDLSVNFVPETNFDKITDGKRHFINKNMVSMYQQKSDHLIYFGDGNEQNRFFKLLTYKWDGPKYKEYYVTNTTNTGEARSHPSHPILGATIGTLIAPGVGTVLGGLAGLGTKTDETTNTQTVTTPEEQEIPSDAVITLQDVQTGEVFDVRFLCNEEMNETLKNFYAFGPLPPLPGPDDAKPAADRMDPFEEMKKMKQMLDLGIITKKEYEEKKQELLGL